MLVINVILFMVIFGTTAGFTTRRVCRRDASAQVLSEWTSNGSKSF